VPCLSKMMNWVSPRSSCRCSLLVASPALLHWLCVSRSCTQVWHALLDTGLCVVLSGAAETGTHVAHAIWKVRLAGPHVQ